MLIARFLHNANIRYGIVSDDVVRVVTGDIFRQIQETGECLPLSEVKLLPPVTPGVVIGLGRNYRSHIEEMGVERPVIPAIFFKPGRSLIAAGEAIILPSWATRVDYEGELGVVIGRPMRSVAEGDVADHIFGYTCFNDITERHIGTSGLINQDISKCCDTFGPCGPWISTECDPYDSRITTILNGKPVQQDNTGNTLFSLVRILSFMSTFMTLMPGDLVVTGTPAGIGPLSPGDTVTVEIEGIGRLTNPVRQDFPQR